MKQITRYFGDEKTKINTYFQSTYGNNENFVQCIEMGEFRKESVNLSLHLWFMAMRDGRACLTFRRPPA